MYVCVCVCVCVDTHPSHVVSTRNCVLKSMYNTDVCCWEICADLYHAASVWTACVK